MNSSTFEISRAGRPIGKDGSFLEQLFEVREIVCFNLNRAAVRKADLGFAQPDDGYLIDIDDRAAGFALCLQHHEFLFHGRPLRPIVTTQKAGQQ